MADNSDQVDAAAGGKGQVDETDARGTRSGAGDIGQTEYGFATGELPVEKESSLLSDEYKMNYPNRGLAVIINNRDFASHTNMGTRTGTDQDKININNRLRVLDFTTEIYDNMSINDMKMLMKKAGKLDHTRNDCFACVILSHGEEGTVYGTDGPVEIKDLVEPFKGHNCPSLAGKPKLFFIQACRGQSFDKGVTVCDALGGKGGSLPMEPVTYRIPTEADFLMAYSVVPGYFSWRNSTHGSWFIRALSEVLKEHADTLDLMTMMTRVNKKVAYEFESNAAKEFMNQKQIPCITSMLTKDVYFRPKPH
ncbi:caspase-3-like [Gigantopelta aegis]|uniref:caspase-3-like n=1 Tax=Gigantopelta aegis TaxID=1735272 RepID=UPI001B88785C|nr:caspase-3-like [Gigantopelta aegis]